MSETITINRLSDLSDLSAPGFATGPDGADLTEAAVNTLVGYDGHTWRPGQRVACVDGEWFSCETYKKGDTWEGTDNFSVWALVAQVGDDDLWPSELSFFEAFGVPLLFRTAAEDLRECLCERAAIFIEINGLDAGENPSPLEIALRAAFAARFPGWRVDVERCTKGLTFDWDFDFDGSLAGTHAPAVPALIRSTLANWVWDGVAWAPRM
jgi:hypothetical protein